MDEIPKEIHKMIDLIAYQYSKTMNNVLYSKDDLKQELYIAYLEKLPKGKIQTSGGWFIAFKNHLNIKFRITTNRQRILRKYTKNIQLEESINDRTNIK